MSEFIRIHYIGKGLYDINSFKKEAKKYGVARALPSTIIKTLKWGDKIYLATYEKSRGVAIIFGYFIIQGINYNGSERLKQAVRSDERLKVVHEQYSGREVKRRCGSYQIGSVTYVDNELKELVEIIEDNAVIETEKAVIKEQFKIFVTGRFYETPLIQVEAPFSRSIVKIPVSKLGSNVLFKVEGETVKTRSLASINDYKQRKRLTKKDKAVFESKGLTAFAEV